MLLMGDRQTVSGKVDTGFDPEWGKKRMLMRMFNHAGMDTPWKYGRYGVCVDDGEEVIYGLTDVPSDVENFVAVAHWYDRRHDWNGNTLDDIDLKVQILNNAGTVLGSRSSYSSTNNKERVRFPMSNFGYNTNIWITLKGYNVTADDEGCGDNSNRVFIS